MKIKRLHTTTFEQIAENIKSYKGLYNISDDEELGCKSIDLIESIMCFRIINNKGCFYIPMNVVTYFEPLC